MQNLHEEIGELIQVLSIVGNPELDPVRYKPLAETICQKLIEKNIETLSDARSRAIIIQSLQEFGGEGLVHFYLEYCEERYEEEDSFESKGKKAFGFPKVKGKDRKSPDAFFSISKQEIQKLLYREEYQNACRDIEELKDRIFALFFERYSLQEVFSPRALEAHREGALDLCMLRCPLKMFTLLFRCDSKENMPSFSWVETMIGLTAKLERLRHFTASWIDVYGIDECFQACETQDILYLLGNVTHNFYRAAPYRFVLRNEAGKFSDRLCMAYQKMDAPEARGVIPPMIVPVGKRSFSKEAFSSLERLCEVALTMRNITFCFRAPSLAEWGRYQKAPCFLGTIVLNLKRAAYKAGRNQIGKFWEEIGALFTIAVKAHLDQRRFFGGLSEGPLRFLFDPSFHRSYHFEHMGFCVEITGLYEAVFFLTGEEMTRGEGKELGIQTIARLHELAQDASEKHEVPILLDDCEEHEESAVRFLEMDSRDFPSFSTDFAPYTRGPHLQSTANLSPKEKILFEGQFHKHLPSVVSLMPEFTVEELIQLLRFGLEETEAIALHVL